MKILLTTHLYPAPGSALADDADALRAFVREWVRAGHEVTVAHAYMHKYTGLSRLKLLLPRLRFSEETLDGARVLRAEMRFVKAVAPLRRAFMRRAAKGFAKALDAEYDLILSHFPVLTAGLPEALPVRGARAAILHTTDLLAARRERVHALWPGYDAVGFRSARIERDARAQFSLDRPGFLVLSGAPEVEAPPARKRMPGEPLRVVYAGKLIERKHADALLHALSYLKTDWRFTVIGDGPLEPRLRALAELPGAKGRVAFAGRLPREETLAEMARHDAFVMVSTGETFGLVYLEAMALGLIVVGTRGEGIDGVIADGENGFLVKAGNGTALTALLSRIAELSEAERAAISRRALDTARRMTERGMAAEYLRRALDACGTRSGREHP